MHVSIIVMLLVCIVAGCGTPLRPLYSNSFILPYENMALGKVQCNGCGPKLTYSMNDVVQKVVQSKITNSSHAITDSKVDFLLDIDLSYSNDRAGIVGSGSATRISNKMVLEYTIREIWSGKIVKQNKLISIETIPVAYSSFTTFFTEEEHASNMLSAILAELFLDIQVLFKEYNC